MILLDTDVCVEILRGNAEVLAARRRESDEVAISFMSAAELYYGAVRSSRPAHNEGLVEAFLLTLPLILPDSAILRRFGRLKSELRRQGQALPDADLFIAATAYERADRLVTGNTQHFARFPNLAVESWAG